MSDQFENKNEKWHEPELVKELRESFGIEGKSVNYKEIESNSEKMDEYLDKFLSFKKSKMSQSSKNYGIFSYKRLSTSHQHILEDHDKAFSEFITRLEERELVLKASISSIPPEVLKTMVYNKAVLDEDKESELFGEKDPHTFAMSFSLENVRDRISSPSLNTDLVYFINENGLKTQITYRDYLIKTFNISLEITSVQTLQINNDADKVIDLNIDTILNTIRESLRDDAGKLIKRHSGIPATTTNSHVTGVIVDDPKNAQAGLQIFIIDSLNKLYPDKKYDLKTAGRDLMVSFGSTKQSSKLVRLTDGSLIVSYATNEGNINQVNNAVSYEKVLKALETYNKADLMSPFVIVDKVSNMSPDPDNGVFQVENKAKKTKFSVKPIQIDLNITSEENRSRINTNLLEFSKSTYVDFDVKTVRELQKYRFGFLSGEEIQRIAEDKIKGKPISELVKDLEDNTAIGNISFGITGIDEFEEAEKVSSIMSDISGYSLAGEILKEFNVDAASVFIPLISDIASFVERTGGLQDNFAGDSINIIYASNQDMKTLRGDSYSPSDFEMLSPAQKAFYAEIAIHTIKDNYEARLGNLLKDTKYMSLVNSIEGNKTGEDNLSDIDNEKLQEVKRLLSSEQDKNIKLAMSYYYVSLIARLRGGKLDLKSMSALSDCSIELVGPTSLREAHDEADQNTAHNITNTETLKAGKFDSDRYVLEDVARKNAIVMDKASFDKLKTANTINSLTISIEDLFTKVIDDKTQKEVYVLKLEDARSNQSIKAMLKTLGIS